MVIDESNIKPMSREKAMESMKEKLSQTDSERLSVWWSGMAYIERIGLIGCANIFPNPGNSRGEMRNLACSDWQAMCGSQQVKLINAVKRLSQRAKSHGVCYV